MFAANDVEHAVLDDLCAGYIAVLYVVKGGSLLRRVHDAIAKISPYTVMIEKTSP